MVVSPLFLLNLLLPKQSRSRPSLATNLKKDLRVWELEGDDLCGFDHGAFLCFDLLSVLLESRPVFTTFSRLFHIIYSLRLGLQL